MSHPFRLGIVLRLREMAEEAARIDLGHAVDAHQRALTLVQAAQGRMRDELDWLGGLQRGPASGGELQAASEAVLAAERGIASAQERLGRASNALFDARQKLAEATRRREVVERLRDRFIAAERREADRQDALAMSEIASTRHALRVAGGRQ